MANYNSITNIATSRTLKLARAFEKLDDVLKKKEKERTRILVKLKNNISDIGKELAKALYNNGDWITMESYFGVTSEYDN